MNPDWNETLDELDAVVVERLAQAVLPMTPPPATVRDTRALFTRWEEALNRLSAEDDLETVRLELEAFRDRLRQVSGIARAA